jgi:hypothetical protein
MKEDVFQTAIFLKKNIDRYRQTLQELEKMKEDERIRIASNTMNVYIDKELTRKVIELIQDELNKEIIYNQDRFENL